MQISKIKYTQFEGLENNWDLQEVNFEKINLIVGKNASGKSKTLALINGISMMLGENKPLSFTEGNFEIVFVSGKKEYKYILEYHNRTVFKEQLLLNKDILINRNEDGKGEIKNYKGETHLFDIPTNELKANRRDKTNYPFLEDLHFWANHTRIFQFSSSASKHSLAIKDPTKKPTEFNIKNTDGGVIPTFSSGKTLHNDTFKNKIINDFNLIGFDIVDIDLGSIASLNFEIIENPNAVISAIRVKERDLNCWTDQMEMSNGMYRALSLIIHFAYYELEKIPGLVIIDDIGEGLDFERASKLIELIVEKVENNTNMQLLMSTNDSFIMNSVDLKYWQIIDRIGSKVKYYNHINSSENFENYQFTGLNHFDFFASGFFKNGFSEVTE